MQDDPRDFDQPSPDDDDRFPPVWLGAIVFLAVVAMVVLLTSP